MSPRRTSSRSPPVSGLLRLTHLDASYCRQLSSVQPLARLTSLERLDLGRTGIEDISSLARLTSLKELSLDGTRVTSLKPLAKLASLQTLSIQETAVTDLSPLSGLSSVLVLDIRLQGSIHCAACQFEGPAVSKAGGLFGSRSQPAVQAQRTCGRGRSHQRFESLGGGHSARQPGNQADVRGLTAVRLDFVGARTSRRGVRPSASETCAVVVVRRLQPRAGAAGSSGLSPWEDDGQHAHHGAGSVTRSSRRSRAFTRSESR